MIHLIWYDLRLGQVFFSQIRGFAIRLIALHFFVFPPVCFWVLFQFRFLVSFRHGTKIDCACLRRNLNRPRVHRSHRVRAKQLLDGLHVDEPNAAARVFLLDDGALDETSGN